MVRIQLETGYLEVKEGTKLPLNFGVADIRDISKRSGTFSKTIKLIGSDNNNNLLNNYYDINIEAGTFDIDVLTTCAVIENGVPIIEDAYLQLVSVDKIQNSNGHDEEVEYSVLIKDAQADFFTKLDNSELTDLDFTDLNHKYTSTNVVASHTHTVTDGYVYPICTNPGTYYPLPHMLPAIYAKLYWDRIHSNNGFSYEWADLTADKFDLAVIPYNGDTPQQDVSSYEVNANKTSFTITEANYSTTITSWTENQDDENLFNPTTGVYDVPFYLIGSQNINFEVTFDVDLTLVNATGANAYLTDVSSFTATPTGLNYEVQIRVRKNGGTTVISVPLDDATFLIADNPLANGSTVLDTLTGTVNFAMGVLLPTDTLTIEARVVLDGVGIGATANDVEWQNLGGTPVSITSQLDFTGLRVSIIPSVDSLGFNQNIIMNDFIPKKIKQKDFIKWICFRWNLYIEQDKDNPNKLIYKTRDTFYDDGAEKDWTLKLAKDKTQQLQFLPELTSKKIILSDKLDTDSYNEAYVDTLNEVYGQVEYTYTNEYVKGTDRKETIFSPTPMIQTNFNAVVPSFDGSTPKNNIRLLLHNGTQECNEYNIVDYGTTGQLNLTDYPVVSHFDNNNNPTFDLNFGVCDYYFYQDLVKTNNNIYNKYWRRTINQINTGKMLVAYFDLREDDIQTLELSDKIRINNSWWNINRVIDYNANAEELTKVELLSVDTEIELAPFQTETPTGTTPPLDPFEDLASRFYDNTNVNYSKGSTIIKGVNNLILPNVKAYVIGDDGIIDSDGYWINGEKVSSGTTQSKSYIFKVVSADYTIDCEADEIIEVDTSGVTITLPNRRNCVGKKLYIKTLAGAT